MAHEMTRVESAGLGPTGNESPRIIAHVGSDRSPVGPLMAPSGSPAPRSPQRRDDLLDAGIELLQEVAPEVMLRALTVRAVARRTNRSTGAFYHYWGTQEEYVHDLIRHLLRPEQMLDADPLGDELARLDGSVLDASTIARLFDRYASQMADDPTMRTMLLLWSLPDEDGQVRSALRDVYRRYQRETSDAYERIVAGTQAELIAGVSFDDVAAMLAAMADGVALRRRVDPDSLPSGAVDAMVHALLASLLAPRGSDRSVDDLAAVVDATLQGG